MISNAVKTMSFDGSTMDERRGLTAILCARRADATRLEPMSSDADRRLMLVHAHPDDETIGSGVTMAHYAEQGVKVTLITCTLGEEGEILVPELEHLGANAEDALGTHRHTELANAMQELGVLDWRLLGKPGKYRDSGMMGEPSNKREDCFWQADLLEAALDLVPVIRAERPQVLITYDDFGGYGHPDHIQAHRAAMYAAALAAAPTFKPDLGPAWDIDKIYWTALSKQLIREGIKLMRELGVTGGFADMDPDDIPFGIDHELVTSVVRGQHLMPKKLAAMHAYPTQIDMDKGFFAMAAMEGAPMGVEYFRLVKGTLGPRDEEGLETDLFAGLLS